MQPNSSNDTTSDDRTVDVPTRNTSSSITTPQRDTAMSILRDRVNSIYDTEQDQQQPAATPKKAAASSPQPTTTQTSSSDESAKEQPYLQEHNAAKSAQHWQQYHSAWQSYYQQYYARYYQSQVIAHQKNIQADLAQREAGQPTISSPDTASSSPRAVLKREIQSKIKQRAKKVRKSTHFWPIISAVVVGALFIGVQYNKLISAHVAAYVAPSSARSQDVIINPNSDTKVGPEPRIIIPKLSVSAPVDYGVNSLDNAVVEDALKHGVVHYPLPGASDFPGEKGHTVILGHSSNDVFDDGDYKFVFLRLEQLEMGDTFYLNYNGTRYTYTITRKDVILPTEVNKLIIQADKPIVSLVTCVPIGTAEKRLVITAEQVSPDPAGATAATGQSANGAPVEIPGNNKSLLENIFGG